MSTKARKFASLVRARATEVGQSSIAVSAGVDVATVSRWFSENRIDQFCAAMEALNLKIVSADLKCYPADEIEALFTLAQSRMKKLRHAAELAEDDE